MNTFPDRLRAGEPRAQQAADRLLRHMGTLGQLHPKELQALQLAADGHVTTPVKNNLARARLKLNARNTPHAVSIAIQERLIR